VIPDVHPAHDLLAAVFVTGAGVLALLILLVGIRTEERHMSLTNGPRTCVGSLARHLTGVGVRWAHQAPDCRCVAPANSRRQWWCPAERSVQLCAVSGGSACM
jgi:hypothetical protein